MHGALTFSKNEEIVGFITENRIRILNLCHIPEDGRLKTLSFSAADKDRIVEIMELGERVDGSSLFSFIEAGKSDIYIKPRIETAFVNPFARLPTLNVLCDYLDETGKPLNVAPRNVLARAEEKLLSKSGVILRALAELEFYIIGQKQDALLFPSMPDKNYHESAPFSRFEHVRNEILDKLAEVGIATKYGHSEVGKIIRDEATIIEQHEIELLPADPASMAETVAIAKWIIRNVCERNGVSASFIPKIALEHAGTGMHIHLCALKNGKNIVARADGTLTDEALMMIGGILRFASSLSAYGNPTPVSYLRFIARKESPMNICWSHRNRLALIRIPLWWSFTKESSRTNGCRETFEYRAPDAFANTYLLLAGIALAASWGLENSEQALKIADDLHIVDIEDKGEKLETLPRSCSESANNLQEDRKLYETGDIFPQGLIDKTIQRLYAYDDRNLWRKLADKPEEIEKVVKQYLHYG